MFRWRLIAWTLVSALVSAGCGETVDSLGYDDASGIVLHRMHGPDTYPNAFSDVLGKSKVQIDAKIAQAFEQLFHGDPISEAIFVPVTGQTQAYIEDVYNSDIRTEGMGLAMLIAYELNKRDEFDRLWNYTKANLVVTTGAARGYLTSSCATPSSPCLDPYGLQHVTMALLLANDLWGSAAVDYAAGARDLLTVMRHKEDQNGGVVGGVTNSFDGATGVVFDQPLVSAANLTRPSIVTPAFYDLWAQATADVYWTNAAASARAFWKKTANPRTGFMPTRAHLDGTPAATGNTFSKEGYRALINIVLDHIWAIQKQTWDIEEADALLRFFISEGVDQYGSEYSLDGKTKIDSTPQNPLIVVNGVTGLISGIEQRKSFVDAVWSMPLPTGTLRYYQGILQLVGLLMLGGQFQVH
jgi:oligosaccharide reducing-end xylanase